MDELIPDAIFKSYDAATNYAASLARMYRSTTGLQREGQGVACLHFAVHTSGASVGRV